MDLYLRRVLARVIEEDMADERIWLRVPPRAWFAPEMYHPSGPYVPRTIEEIYFVISNPDVTFIHIYNTLRNLGDPYLSRRGAWEDELEHACGL